MPHLRAPHWSRKSAREKELPPRAWRAPAHQNSGRRPRPSRAGSACVVLVHEVGNSTNHFVIGLGQKTVTEIEDVTRPAAHSLQNLLRLAQRRLDPGEKH